jgi:outer membrane protein assembly factor BamE (lipoprotein component of BamABCDE complex)
MRARIAIFLLALALLPQSGCIMLPIPTADRKILEGKPVSPEQFAFLSPGVTTKEQVDNRLGKPDVIWEEARVYGYNWVMRSGVLFWAVGGGYSGAAGLADIPSHHVLLIQFDRRDRVRRFESVVRPPLKPYGDFLKEWVKDAGKSQSVSLNRGKE